MHDKKKKQKTSTQMGLIPGGQPLLHSRQPRSYGHLLVHPSSVSLCSISPLWKKCSAQVVSPGRTWAAPLGLLLLALPAPGLIEMSPW